MDGLHTELALGLIGQLQTAPFVAKTYQMVCEPRTDALIRWGRDNNSFVVADVAGFSQLLLPCFFKHGNFSSFVRQLNTYGFRKVHPDRWEFAHESFLRGQTHLLPRIVRRKKRGEGSSASCSSAIDGGGGHETQHVAAASTGEELELDDDDDEEEGREALLLEEVQRLRREQTAIGEQLARMSRRLQETERRPDQFMSFLTRLADEDSSVHLLEQAAAEKKRQRMQMQMQMQFPSRDFAAPSSPSPIALRPPPRPPVIDDAATVDGVWRLAEQKPARRSITTSEQPAASSGAQQVPEFEGGGSGSGVGMGRTDGGAAVETPFPFCLLGQCFF